MAPIFDFECTKCAHREDAVFYHVKSLPRRRKCPECGKVAMEQVFDAPRRALINAYSSGVGYGKWNHQAQCVIRDYYHKRELMAKYGWEEACDPVKGNRAWSEDLTDDGQPDPEPDGGAGVMWGDVEETREAVERARRDQTGLKVG